MFLYSLDIRQRELFMELAIKAAECNGIVESEEINMLQSYGTEMGLQPIYETNKSTESIVSELKEISDEKTKRIILFELFAILISDSCYDDKEKRFVERLGKEFSISADDRKKMLDILYEYRDVVKRITDLVL